VAFLSGGYDGSVNFRDRGLKSFEVLYVHRDDSRCIALCNLIHFLVQVHDDAINGIVFGLHAAQSLGVSGMTAYLALRPAAGGANAMPSSVSLFDQGLLQVLQASVTGLAPKQPNVLALADRPDGSGDLQPLSAFMTNPAGAAIVNAVGPIRQIVRSDVQKRRRYLAIVAGSRQSSGRSPRSRRRDFIAPNPHIRLKWLAGPDCSVENDSDQPPGDGNRYNSLESDQGETAAPPNALTRIPCCLEACARKS